jgi:hypothetical protein
MKKFSLLLLVIILLTACELVSMPEPTTEPTHEPEEALADSANDLFGVWWFPKGGLMLEFKDDGTSRVFSGSANIGQIASGTYTFDNGVVTFNPGGACKDPATYETYITTLDGNPVSIRMQVVGSDSCSDRAKLLTNLGKFHKP